MMFGFRDEFTYFECHNCGCLQIVEFPKNMTKYYPSSYYSFERHESDNFIKKILVKKRDKYVLLKKGFIGKVIYMKYPNPFFEMISMAKINRNSKILDVGCGAGDLLFTLKKLGFKNLKGLDPFIVREVIDKDIKILNRQIHELPVEQKYDLIIFKDSFEHIPNQLETLFKVREILSKKGGCLIKMPIKTEYIWSLYGVNWVQIDAPRHFFIHTLKSFEFLVRKSGMIVQDVIFDSSEFQFWSSEQYQRDIPLMAEKSYLLNPNASIFTKKQIKEFKEMSEELNKKNQGDKAVFYLTIR